MLLPADEPSLKENVLEAFAFGILNFVIMFWAISLLLDREFTSQSYVPALARALGKVNGVAIGPRQ